jgi:hypothetical protein
MRAAPAGLPYRCHFNTWACLPALSGRFGPKASSRKVDTGFWKRSRSTSKLERNDDSKKVITL